MIIILNYAICNHYVPVGIIRSLNIGIAARTAAGVCLRVTYSYADNVFRRADNFR